LDIFSRCLERAGGQLSSFIEVIPDCIMTGNIEQAHEIHRRLAEEETSANYYSVLRYATETQDAEAVKFLGAIQARRLEEYGWFFDDDSVSEYVHVAVDYLLEVSGEDWCYREFQCSRCDVLLNVVKDKCPSLYIRLIVHESEGV